MNTKLFALPAIAGLALAFNASAAQDSFYVSLKGGAVIPGTKVALESSDTSKDKKLSEDKLWGFKNVNAQFGYEIIDGLDVSANFSWNSIDNRSSEDSKKDSANYFSKDSMNFGLALTYSFMPDNMFSPYIEAGAGAQKNTYTYKIQDSKGTVNIADSKVKEDFTAYKVKQEADISIENVGKLDSFDSVEISKDAFGFYTNAGAGVFVKITDELDFSLGYKANMTLKSDFAADYAKNKFVVTGKKEETSVTSTAFSIKELDGAKGFDINLEQSILAGIKFKF
jgi:opacity protein-like surface antigen